MLKAMRLLFRAARSLDAQWSRTMAARLITGRWRGVVVIATARQ
jgi:hypothetical protein